MIALAIMFIVFLVIVNDFWNDGDNNTTAST